MLALNNLPEEHLALTEAEVSGETALVSAVEGWLCAAPPQDFEGFSITCELRIWYPHLVAGD